MPPWFDAENLLESFLRWIHVVSAITWIGLLYFLNWVYPAFSKTLRGETRREIAPELLPPCYYWFRWGAAFTWISGVMLLVLVFYINKTEFFGATGDWHALGGVMVGATFLSVAAYDYLYRKPFRKAPVGFIIGWVLASAMVILFRRLGEFEFRAQAVHLGAMFGTMMAFNVWFRIWPAQRRILRAIKDGEEPDPGLVTLAGQRSMHNTYMSVPVVFAMISQHGTWAFSGELQYVALPGVILFGWLVAGALTLKSESVGDP